LPKQTSTDVIRINQSFDNNEENEEIFKKTEDLEDIDDFEVVRE